jgi:putative addiction module component (TIGR02574 family)
VAAADSLALTPERVLAEALALPAGERLQIASELLASVEEPAPGEDDEAWLAEIRARAERAHRGESRARPWEDVKRDVLARLRAR